jgi:hypothetical protein
MATTVTSQVRPTKKKVHYIAVTAQRDAQLDRLTIDRECAPFFVVTIAVVSGSQESMEHSLDAANNIIVRAGMMVRIGVRNISDRRRTFRATLVMHG